MSEETLKYAMLADKAARRAERRDRDAARNLSQAVIARLHAMSFENANRPVERI